jgi:hypothetical protein
MSLKKTRSGKVWFRTFLCGSEKLIVSVIVLFIQISGNAQITDSTKGPCEVKDATDYIKQWLHIKKKNTQKNTAIFAAPVLGSTPSTGFIYGLTLQGTFKLPESNISAFQSNIQFTSKQQFSVSLKNNVFAKKNKIFLSGDWSYFNYSQPTYGLGTDAPNGKVPEYFYFNQGAPDDSLVQPMKYTYVKLHQTFSFRAARNLFIGPGIHIDLYSQIDDIKLDTSRLTSHYLYSKKYGFDPKKYDVIGVSLNMVYDSRDNSVNAYKGIYANLNYRYNPEFLGSDQASSTLWSEFRAYVGVSKKNHRNCLRSGSWAILPLAAHSPISTCRHWAMTSGTKRAGDIPSPGSAATTCCMQKQNSGFLFQSVPIHSVALFSPMR